LNVVDEQDPNPAVKTHMKPSFKEDSKQWLQSIRNAISRTHWKEDFIRGLKAFQNAGAFIGDRSFSETELFRLRRQVEQMDEKIEQAFQSLGKRSMEHWESQQVLDEKEQLRAFKQIDALTQERQEILEKIDALKASPHRPLNEGTDHPPPENEVSTDPSA